MGTKKGEGGGLEARIKIGSLVGSEKRRVEGDLVFVGGRRRGNTGG